MLTPTALFLIVTCPSSWTLTRADYAMTLLDVAENAHMFGKALGVGGPKPAKRSKLQAIER